MKLTQLLPIVLATVTMGWAGKITASQTNELSSIKIIVKAPAEELELFCASPKYHELAHYIAILFNSNYKEADLSICKVAACLLKVERKNIIDCFQQNTGLEIATLTKTQREALQLLNALVKGKNTTYNEYSIQAYENLYLAFNSSNIPTSVNLFWPIPDGLFQHYQNSFFENHIFYFEKLAQYLKKNYTTEEAYTLAQLFKTRLQFHQEVFSFGGSREALAKCEPPLSEISGWARFEQESKALEKEQQATIQEAENLKKQAAEEQAKTPTVQQGPAPKMAHADHAPLNKPKPAATVEPTQEQQKPADALDQLEADGLKFPETKPDNNVFMRTTHFFRENRWAKYTAYVLMTVVVCAAAVYGFGKYRNARKLVRSAGRWV